MNFIKRYFDNKRAKKEYIQNAIEAFEKQKECEYNAELERIAIQKSDTPHVQYIGEGSLDIINIPDEPAYTRYEYNNAFIKKLKSEGYSGSDELIISEWEKATIADKISKIVERHFKTIKDSTRPWVKMEGITEESYEDNSLQVRAEFDFNKAFVRMLRDNGYTGSSDEIVVYKWFKAVAEIIAVDIHGERFDG